MIDDTMYDSTISILNENGCILRLDQNKNETKPKNGYKTKRHEFALTQDQIDRAVDILVNHANGVYGKGNRNEFTLCYAGHLSSNRIGLDSALLFCRTLCNLIKDEELDSRILTVKSTYSKQYAGESVKGKSGLIESFARYNSGINIKQKIF